MKLSDIFRCFLPTARIAPSKDPLIIQLYENGFITRSELLSDSADQPTVLLALETSTIFDLFLSGNLTWAQILQLTPNEIEVFRNTKIDTLFLSQMFSSSDWKIHILNALKRSIDNIDIAQEFKYVRCVFELHRDTGNSFSIDPLKFHPSYHRNNCFSYDGSIDLSLAEINMLFQWMGIGIHLTVNAPPIPTSTRLYVTERHLDYIIVDVDQDQDQVQEESIVQAPLRTTAPALTQSLLTVSILDAQPAGSAIYASRPKSRR